MFFLNRNKHAFTPRISSLLRRLRQGYTERYDIYEVHGHRLLDVSHENTIPSNPSPRNEQLVQGLVHDFMIEAQHKRHVNFLNRNKHAFSPRISAGCIHIILIFLIYVTLYSFYNIL